MANIWEPSEKKNWWAGWIKCQSCNMTDSSVQVSISGVQLEFELGFSGLHFVK